MPYTTCPKCRKSVYTAAAHTPSDPCPHCHEPMQRAARLAEVRALQRSFAARDALTHGAMPGRHA
jgi:ssDNA-binding Zn-finger/Zn-ribbon topoisomerase 1